jgi:hypothetical protein
VLISQVTLMKGVFAAMAAGALGAEPDQLLRCHAVSRTEDVRADRSLESRREVAGDPKVAGTVW